MTRDWKVPELAEKWRTNQARVLEFIHSGELVAVNIGNGKLKPRWRVTDEARIQFEQSRSTRTRKPVEKSKTKKRTFPSHV